MPLVQIGESRFCIFFVNVFENIFQASYVLDIVLKFNLYEAVTD